METSINRLLHMGIGIALFVIGCFLTFQGEVKHQEIEALLSEKWHQTYKARDEHQPTVDRQPHFSGAVVLKLCLEAEKASYEIILNGQPYNKTSEILSEERAVLLSLIQLSASYKYEILYIEEQIKRIRFDKISWRLREVYDG